ncbi:hypothetical protein N499_0318A, partial [Wolbachia pipientis wVitA]
MSEI